jgi:hypothetical protein
MRYIRGPRAGVLETNPSKGGLANELQGKKVAFSSTDMVEQVELTEPWKAVEQAGAEPELARRGRDPLSIKQFADTGARLPS